MGDSTDTIRARAPLLRALLRGLAATTAAGCLLLGSTLVAQGRFVELVAGAVVVVALLTIDLAPLPFRWRAVAMLAFWGTGATVMLLVTGISMGPAFAGFLLPILAALFLGGRATILAFAWSLASLAAVGLLGQAGIVAAPPDPTHTRLAYQHWPLLMVSQLIVSGPVALVAQRLLAGLEHAIAERDRLIADLKRAQQGLAEAERVKTLGLLAGGVVHDLANSLTVMAAEVDLIPGLDGEARLTLGGMVTDAIRLARQVLLPAGKLRAELRPIELQAALRPALTAIRRMLPAGVELRVQGDGAPLAVMADASLLQQALLNLAVNARDAMPGGGRLEVRLGRIDRGGLALATVEVADTGHGMDAATLARAGEPLFTTKAPGEGTGLGLSNVRATMLQHGGELEMRSTAGAGTLVTLRIPLGEPGAGADRGPQRPTGDGVRGQ